MSNVIDWAPLESVWQRETDIIAAWVFGSARSGKLLPGSDLDLGLLLRQTPALDEVLRLQGVFQDALAVEEVDLVILNDANPVLRFEAVSGRRLFAKDMEAVVAFVSLSAREYEDEITQWQDALRRHRKPAAVTRP